MSAREKVAIALWRLRHPDDIWPDGHVGADVYRDLADAAIAAHMEALKADGCAVVKLPEVSREDLYHQYWISIAPNASIKYEYDGGWDSTEHVREFAAALLAAAAKAEADE